MRDIGRCAELAPKHVIWSRGVGRAAIVVTVLLGVDAAFT